MATDMKRELRKCPMCGRLGRYDPDKDAVFCGHGTSKWWWVKFNHTPRTPLEEVGRRIAEGIRE